MSGPMVRAILDDLKTQTRRIVKLSYAGRVKAVGSHKNWHLNNPNCVKACPFGGVGDLLWVRETFYPSPNDSPTFCGYYRATDPDRKVKWHPSIHMPRAASRLTLEITGVRVERLNDISEADAIAEGAPTPTGRRGAYPAPWATAKAGPTDYRESYRALWKLIHGPGSWALNPWVWVISFRRHTP